MMLRPASLAMRLLSTWEVSDECRVGALGEGGYPGGGGGVYPAQSMGHKADIHYSITQSMLHLQQCDMCKLIKYAMECK
jgi:hypothetical protein